MTRYQVRAIIPLTLALTATVGAGAQSQTQTPPSTYPAMAPTTQYLMADRAGEIALARSAAPAAIADRAEIMVLGPRGYETAAAGDNGFVCVVERSWMSPFDSPQFWNPKLRAPICFNPPAARSILPMTLLRTKLALSRVSRTAMIDSLGAALTRKAIPELEPGTMAYMMSKDGFLDDSAGRWLPHLMFFVPVTVARTWGADLPHSPALLNPPFAGAPFEPFTVVMIPVRTWSDGSEARPM